MFTIRNYTDTLCELEVSKTRLNLLVDRKLALYDKYFPTSANIKEVLVQGGEERDSMVEFMHELNDEIDVGTGMSVGGEIDYQRNNILKLEKYIDNMNNSLSKMQGIEYQLFYEIVFKGVNITKAVENVAELNGKDVSTLWKNHYNKIKKDIERIKIVSSEFLVN